MQGGLNRYFYELLRALPAVGVPARGLVVGSGDIRRSMNGAVEPFATPDAGTLARCVGVRRAWTRAAGGRVGILPVCHFAYHALPILDRLIASRFVLHFQGPWARESAMEGAGALAVSVKRVVERTVYRQAARAIVLSNAFGLILEQDYAVAPELISVIPGGVDADRFALSLTKAEARVRLGWPTDRPIVLAVRRLARRMGLEHLVDAAALVRARVPDLLLMIGGRGALQGALAARVLERGLEPTVRLLGRLSDEDLALAYRAADVTVVPSVALEGFGLVAAESLASGTPVLVTPVGGLPDVVSGLATDLILPEATVEAIAEGLVAALLGTMALPDEATCRRFARERYDWSVIAAAVGKIYRDVADGET
jgi:glycosyltransferase involved in cell wall biosynthesis